jgi:hypothetical protein
LPNVLNSKFPKYYNRSMKRHWDFEFLKNDEGKFTKCRIVNAGMGIDAVGEKIGG